MLQFKRWIFPTPVSTKTQLSELAVEGLSQLSEELDEESGFFLAAPFGAALSSFSPASFAFLGTGAASVRPTKKAYYSFFWRPGIFQSSLGFLQDAIPMLGQVLRKAFWAGIKDMTSKKGEGRGDKAFKMQSKTEARTTQTRAHGITRQAG